MWEEDVKDAASRRKDGHKTMCQNSTEENKRRYKSIKNESKKAVREKAEEANAELKNSQMGHLD